MKHLSFFTNSIRDLNGGRTRVDTMVTTRSLFRKTLLFLAFILLPMTGWGATYKLIDGSTINSGNLTSDFFTGVTSLSDVSCSISGSTYTKAIVFAGTGNPGVANTDRYIKYDVKSTQTQIKIYAYNKNTGSARKVKVGAFIEGKTSGETASEHSIAKKSGLVIDKSFTNTTNTSIYITVPSNAGDVYICQVEAIETGTDLKKGATPGYSLSANKGRVSVKSGTKTIIDGIEILPSGDYAAASSTVLKLKTASTNYICFKTNQACNLDVTASTTDKKFYINTTKGGQTGTEYKTTVTGVALDANTTYYINPAGSEVQITKLEFKAAASKHSVTYALNGGSGTTPTQADVAEGKTFKVAGTTGITAPTDKVFKCWFDGSNNYNPNDDYTMGTSDVTLTAQWDDFAQYDVKFMSNGAQVGDIQKITKNNFATAPADPVVADKYFLGWSTDGTEANIQNVASYPITANTTFTAVLLDAVTYTADFTYVENSSKASLISDGWTFMENGTDASNQSASEAMYFGASSTPVSNAGKDNIAIAKNTSAYAMFELGEATRIFELNISLKGGSSSAFNGKIELIGANGSTVKATYTPSLNAGNWTANNLTYKDIKDVKYIRVYGASKWIAMTAFEVIYAGTPVTKYDLTFAANGGTGTMNTKKYVENAEVTVPACGFTAPEYKQFDKWTVTGLTDVTELAPGAKFNMPANTVALTAQWKAKPYTDDLYLIGGACTGMDWTLDNAAKMTSDGKGVYTLSNVSIKSVASGSSDGFKFLQQTSGWEGQLRPTTENATVLNEDNSYAERIAYDASNIQAAFKAGSITPDTKWQINADEDYTYNITVDLSDMANGKMTLTPLVGQKYTITSTTPENGTFTVKVGDEVVTEAAKNATVVLTATPNDGYEFSAWDVYKTGEEATKVAVSNNQFTMPAYAVTVAATFVVSTKVTVSFDAKGGTEVPNQKVEIDDHATTPTNCTKANHILSGWSLTDGGDPVVVEDVVITKDTTFYAVWAMDNIAVRQIVFSNTFDAFIDVANKVVQAYYMQGETAPTVQSFNADNVQAMTVKGNKLAITDTEGGCAYWNLTLAEVAPLTSFSKQTFGGSETYVKSGYPFDGTKKWRFSKTDNDWSRETPGKTRVYFFVGPSEKATFECNTGSRAIKVYVNGTLLEAPTTTVKDGTMEVSLNQAQNNMIAIVSNQTNGDGGLSSIQLAPVYDVTFVSEKGTAPAATTAKSITLPEITGVEGFDHIGWKANKAVTVGGSAVAAGDTMAVGAVAVLAEATEFTACWRVYVPKYTVTFNANGGTPEPAKQVVDENTKPAAVADPAKDHAAFQGWSLNGTDIVTVTDVVITQDTTFYAIWKTKYDVTFDTKGGTTIEPRQIVEGEKVGAVTDPEKWDNTFAGWNKKGSAEIIADIADEVITANVTYEANWTPETGVIKLIEGGAINTTNFITGATMQEGTITYQGVDLPFARHGGNATSVSAIGNNLTKAIIYNATTTQTKIKVVANNNPEGTSARYIYIWSVLEGSTEATKLGEYELKNGSFVETPYLECNNAAHRSIYVTTSSNSNVAILQVKVIESGDALVKVGEAGYSLNMNKGRMVMVSGQDAAQSFEDLNFVKLGSNYGVVNSANLSLASTNGKCSFTVANDIKLSVTTSTTTKYYVTQSLEEKTNETTPTANTATSFDLTPGTWYIVAGGSAVGLTNISFSKPNAPKPEITTQPQTYKQFAQGNMTATVEVAAVAKGTLSYQWYDASDDSEVTGATDATLTTTTEGSYYVIVSNTLENYNTSTTKSETATLAYRTLDDATLSALGYGETAITLVDAQYTYEVELAKGTTEVPALTATTSSSYATKVITNATAFVDYKATSTVVVTAEDLTTQLTYTVNFTVRHDVEQVSVSETTVWNWTNAASASIKLSDSTTPKKNEECVMANIEGVNNDANFNSQALVFYGENVKNTDGGVNYASIGHIKFTTTVPGMVTVEFADNGNNNRRLMINDSVSESSTSKTDYKTFSVPVNAGEVTLMGVKPDKTGTNQYIRIRKITFTAAEFVRGGLVPGRIYTTCQANNMLGAWGVEMYEPENWDGFYVTFKEATELKAGYGYLFVATEAAMYAVFGEDEVSAAVPDAPNAMQGTLEDINLPEGNNYCGVKNNHLQYFGANNTMTANHAYIVIDEINKQPQAPAAARRIRLSREGSSVVTDLDNVAFGGETDLGEPRKFIINDQVVIIRNGQMYNAQGALLR